MEYSYLLFISHHKTMFKLSQSARLHYVPLTGRGVYLITCNPGASLSKVRRTFRVRKATRKTPTCLFCKAGLFICCKGNKNKNNSSVLPRHAFVLKIQRELCPPSPKCTRKVSGLRETGPWGVTVFLESHENFSGPKNQLSKCNPLVLTHL